MPDAASTVLFDEALLEQARARRSDAPLRWLALSEDPEAVNLRHTLESCWALAGAARPALRAGLVTDRWGQHMGAMAQLFVLGLLRRGGFEVSCDPPVDGQSPDVLARRGDRQLLVEVRAITGQGRRPWEQRALEGRDLTDEEEARLADAVCRVLEQKAGVYGDLAHRRALPYLIVLYQDTDRELSRLVPTLLFGVDGLLAAQPRRFATVSAVAVLGRVDNDEGDVAFEGELLIHDAAALPLPVDPRELGLRVLHSGEGGRWYGGEPPSPPFELG